MVAPQVYQNLTRCGTFVLRMQPGAAVTELDVRTCCFRPREEDHPDPPFKCEARDQAFRSNRNTPRPRDREHDVDYAEIRAGAKREKAERAE